MVSIVFLATLTLSVEKDQSGILGFSTSIYAQTTPPSTPSCFVRTISKCPKVMGQDGGERVTCDLSGTYVAGSTCTPVICVTGTGPVQTCTQPN